MARPEASFGEKTGEVSRNTGIGLLALSIFLYPGLFWPGAGLAVGGEVFRRNREKAASGK